MLDNNTTCNFNLFLHQAAAVQWMRIIEYLISNPQNMAGGILADDMGLGKTKDAVALIAFNIVNRTVILTPSVTRYSFIRQCLEILPQTIRVYTIETDSYEICSFNFVNGIQEIKTVKLDTRKGEKMLTPFVLIANYSLIAAAKKNYSLVTSIIWDRIFVDEGHFLRNKNDTWNLLSQLQQPIDMSKGYPHRIGSRWVITGTPIQMGVNDLNNIFRFIDSRFLASENPNYLDREMKQLICTNLFRRNKDQLTQYMKRLMKFPEHDPEIYDELITLQDTDLSLQLEKCSYEQLFEFSKNQQFVVNVLKDEKAYCIVLACETYWYNMQKEKSQFQEASVFRNTFSNPFSTIPKCFSQNFPNQQLIYTGTNSKLRKFQEIVNSKHGESFVIFYHYNAIRDAIKELCQRQYPTYYIFMINGEVTSDKERDNIIQTTSKLIDEGQSCFLLSSIMATAAGVNYQKFSNMISFEPEYNSKTEDQADARIQRIGQENLVNIWKFAVADFNTAYGVISIDLRTQKRRDETAHFSQIIDQYNAAFSFKRYYIPDENGQMTSGVNFGDAFESLPPGTVGGPNSVGPDWIH